MMSIDEKAIVLIAGDMRPKLAEIAALVAKHGIGAPIIDFVEVRQGMDRAMYAAEVMLKVSGAVREIQRHPRYRDSTPRSPKPRFRKGR